MELPPNSVVEVCPDAGCDVWYWITPLLNGIHRCPKCGTDGEVIYRTGDATPQDSAADAA
jgi:hypothetical protein